MSLGNFTRRGGGGSKPTDPQALFDSLTLRGSVENLWQPQSAALNEWHKHRTESDITIEMPTGGGKTLVGLLVAQSIANESKGRVVYVCPNNQLVEQTAVKAREVGLTVATYMNRTWENKDEFLGGTIPCITSYASAFLPFRTSRNENLEALIVDDAHVAVGELKSRFTLRIDSDHQAYTPLKAILQTCAVSASRGGRFDEAIRGEGSTICYLPSFTTSPKALQIQHVLHKSGINDDSADTRFVWAYLADKMDRCLFFVCDKRIEITAALPSIESVRAIASSNRRVYLTATLPSPYEAARVLGNRIFARMISPKGKLGAAQKMLGFVRGDDSTAQRNAASKLIQDHKACIIVPSRSDAEKKWPGIPVYGKSDGEAGLDQFRRAQPPEKLVLAGRFDGIDLPGDSCRVLALDGLPRGAHLLDRFLAESIRSRELRASGTAIKIVQAIGRIFRSNTDHGAVLLIGDDLHRWLMEPYNLGFLPPLLQQQIQIALDFKADIKEGRYTLRDLLNGVLNAEPTWDRLYNDNLPHYQTSQSSFDPRISDSFLKEHLAAKAMWDGGFAEASQRYREAALIVVEKEPALAGWFYHLAGLAAQLAGDHESAAALFFEAASLRAEFGRPPGVQLRDGARPQAGEQATRIAVLLNEPGKFLSRLEKVLGRLSYDVPSSQVEDAVCELGKLLGLDAERPDNTRNERANVKTGPDVIWVAPWRNEGAFFELKTGKQPTSLYTKLDDIAKCHDHVQWLTTNKSGITFFEFILGRHLGVVPEANPSLELRVVELDEIVRIAKQLERLATTALQATLQDRPSLIQATLKIEGMLWPRLVDGIDARLALDLQSNPPALDDEDQ